MSVDEVSRELYQELQESGYLSKMRVQNLIWIHEFYQEFGDWPTTGELQDWINKEQSATIIKDGLKHAEVGPNQIRPRCNELHGDHGVVEKLEKREQKHTSTVAHPYRILYDRVEEEMDVNLRSNTDKEEYETKIRNGTKIYVVDGKEYLFPPDELEEDTQQTVESSGEDDVDAAVVDGSDEAQSGDEAETDEEESEQKVLFKDGEVVR